MKLLTLARDLRRRKARDRQRLFTAEGVRAAEELLRSPLRVRGALVAPQLLEAPRGAALHAALHARDVEVAEVDARTFASAADTDSPQGILVVAEVPSHTLQTFESPASHDAATAPLRLVVLDGVQDPGNVGTILRSAAALGASAVAALPGTVDLWNAKVVRAAMGASFRLPTFSCTWDALDRFRSATHVTLWAADAAGIPLGDLPAPTRLALVVGNEGAGLTAESRSRAAAVVALPIASSVESLNVAVATSIFLYQLRA